MSIFRRSPAPPERRIWAQDVAVQVRVMRARLAALQARLGPEVPPEQEAVISGVRELLDAAEKAAFRRDPTPSRVGNWWRGTLIEAAYQNMHAAEAEIVVLYDDAEVAAEIPEALARVEQSLHRHDARRHAARLLPTLPEAERRAALRKAVEVGTDASDRQHTRVRSFRNVVLVTALLLLLLVISCAVAAAASPRSLPLCFTPEGGSVCPSGPGPARPQDAAVVAFVGAVGGALAAAVSIRKLRGTSTPYDMPVALSLLKVPAGALTALGALIAIRGDFVPGLSDLDSQEQILAYALVFGYSQQLLTRLIDDRAESVLDSVASKDAAVDRPVSEDQPPPHPPAPANAGANGAPGPSGLVPAPRSGDEVTVPEQDEVDVLDLVDTDPVPLVAGPVGDEAYGVLLAQHFGEDEPHDDEDRFEGVGYDDASDGHVELVAQSGSPLPGRSAEGER